MEPHYYKCASVPSSPSRANFTVRQGPDKTHPELQLRQGLVPFVGMIPPGL